MSRKDNDVSVGGKRIQIIDVSSNFLFISPQALEWVLR